MAHTIATGEPHTVKDFVTIAFEHLGLAIGELGERVGASRSARYREEREHLGGHVLSDAELERAGLLGNREQDVRRAGSQVEDTQGRAARQ